MFRFPLILALLASACAAPAPTVDLEALRERHDLELEEQARAERAFREDLVLPEERDLGPLGRLIVSHAELAGRLGDEIVRVRMTYQNTTDDPIADTWLVLEVHDTEREVIHSVAEPVRLPMGLRFYSGSSYTTTLTLPTQGAHLTEGWSWMVDVQTRPEE